MGYDCTLHLVDEQAIRNEFVPHLLRTSTSETALDRVMENAGDLWNTVRDSLKNDEPDKAASLICQLAVMFSAVRFRISTNVDLRCHCGRIRTKTLQ